MANRFSVTRTISWLDLELVYQDPTASTHQAGISSILQLTSGCTMDCNSCNATFLSHCLIHPCCMRLLPVYLSHERSFVHWRSVHGFDVAILPSNWTRRRSCDRKLSVFLGLSANFSTTFCGGNECSNLLDCREQGHKNPLKSKDGRDSGFLSFLRVPSRWKRGSCSIHSNCQG